MKYFLLSIIFVFITASCERSKSVYFQSELIQVLDSVPLHNDEMHAMVNPYALELQVKMDEKLGFASCDMLKNRPEGNLDNFVADLVLNYALKDFVDSVDVKLVALFNHGGLRAPLNRGDILLRHVYELMPFENELVYIKLEASRFQDIRNYLLETGGEPLAGFSYKDTVVSNDFWVVTSDYLAEGGDRMNFFLDPVYIVKTGHLLRDRIIDEVKLRDTICVQLDGRWR